MAGHSKWHNIRHKKGAEDAKKSILYTRISSQIRNALDHGGNVPTNLHLQNVLKKAKDLKVPKEIIERSIEKAMQAKSGGVAVYEGVGPSGVSFMVQCITDNRARTFSHLKHLFSKHGGNLAGSVAYKFKKVGAIEFHNISKEQEEDFMDKAISLGAEEIEGENGEFSIECAPDSLGTVVKGLEELGYSCESSQLAFVATTPIEVSEDARDAISSFVEDLEGDGDVEAVYHDAV
ncbi:hypothetical protein GUITHDRAFT_70520 [Guillardia theta CCMP2712]|uniref:Transcriptional regulatory protein n=3 Tax=Guillardia theta TaxID=55529 RepID=L1JDV5_GUITC|nr:hypothetical protein GUITHDRAFT_70520 [Guillardia theta CCMP2712]EKX46497.1 hypothetical protein GUITHDRAFT_70520 [Guillardia theta CCMP2712]|eukprot:XP_005833477.1 hypothetical protein GUITHDRAFT_70520 [Guillardia theta CCMP2712]